MHIYVFLLTRFVEWAHSQVAGRKVSHVDLIAGLDDHIPESWHRRRAHRLPSGLIHLAATVTKEQND